MRYEHSPYCYECTAYAVVQRIRGVTLRIRIAQAVRRSGLAKRDDEGEAEEVSVFDMRGFCGTSWLIVPAAA